MSFNKFTPLTKLSSSKIKWNIRVRAQAVWKGITRETKEFRGMNMILVDDSKFRIHAFITARLANLFEKDLEEGQIYTISNFIVQEYTGVEFHRCVRFDKHIYFAEYTKLSKCTQQALEIPKCSFDFFNLQDLETMESDKRFLCDVAGIVKDDIPLRDYVNDTQEEKKQKKFTITDGRYAVKVTFFDQFAEYVEQSFKKKENRPLAIIIASAKIGRFQGDLTLTNYPATRVYMDANHNVLEDLIIRAKQPTFYKDLSVKADEQPQMMTVKDIKQLTDEYIQKKVVCAVTIKKVEENLHWYDCICPKCNKLLQNNNDRYQCEKCGKYFPWPPKRFRVCLYGCDSTGGLPIILGDREVRKLTGKTVFDITLDQAEGDEEKFPEEIKEFRNRSYQITLKISADNINHESDVYEATDISIGGEDNNATQTSQSIASPSAEDDNSLIEMELTNTQTTSQANTQQTPKAEKRIKNPRASTNLEHENEIADDMCLSKFKPTKVKKEKDGDKKAIKRRSPATGNSSNKEAKKIVMDEEISNEDEQISLSNMQKNLKTKGKKGLQ